MRNFIRYSLLTAFAFVGFQSCSKEDKTFTLEDANAFESSINGTVLSRKEKPLAGVLVVANPGGYTTVSGVDGSFSFSRVKAGKYLVQYIKEDYRDTLLSESIEVGLRDSREANPVKLQYRFASIRGNVSDGVGEPLIGAGIVVEDQEGGVLSQSGGKFSLAKVEPGKVRLFSVVQGTGYGYTDVDLVADSVYEDIEVRLDKRGGVVKGKVVDKDDKPLSGVDISAYQGALVAETGSDGSFTMSEIPKIGDNRMQIGSGDMTTFCGGMYLGMKDTLDVGKVVLERMQKGALMVPSSFHMTNMVDTTVLIMPWTSSEDSLRPILFYWSFDDGSTWITTMEPRLTIVPSQQNWDAGIHEVSVRCMSMDSIESNTSVISVKVEESTEMKLSEDTTGISSSTVLSVSSAIQTSSSSRLSSSLALSSFTAGTSSAIVQGSSSSVTLYTADALLQFELSNLTTFSFNFQAFDGWNASPTPYQVKTPTGQYTPTISSLRFLSGTRSLSLFLQNVHADGVSGSLDQAVGVKVSPKSGSFIANGSTVSFWMSSVTAVTSSRWAWSHGVGFAGAADTSMVWFRCKTWGNNEACLGNASGSPTGFDSYDSARTGADGAMWYHYTVRVPTGYTQSKVFFLFEQASWDGTTASSQFYLDDVQGLSTTDATQLPVVSSKPVINIGLDSVPVCLGKSLWEPGWTVLDDKDKGLDTAVTVDKSALDVNTVGKYPIFYYVQDSEGLRDTAVRYAIVEKWDYLDWGLDDSMVVEDFDNRNGNWLYKDGTPPTRITNLGMIRKAELPAIAGGYWGSGWYCASKYTTSMNPSIDAQSSTFANSIVLKNPTVGNDWVGHFGFVVKSDWGQCGIYQSDSAGNGLYFDYSDLDSIAVTVRGSGGPCLSFTTDANNNPLEDGYGELQRCFTLSSTWQRIVIKPSEFTMMPNTTNVHTWANISQRISSIYFRDPQNLTTFDLYIDRIVFYGVPFAKYLNALPSRY